MAAFCDDAMWFKNLLILDSAPLEAPAVQTLRQLQSRLPALLADAGLDDVDVGVAVERDVDAVVVREGQVVPPPTRVGGDRGGQGAQLLLVEIAAGEPTDVQAAGEPGRCSCGRSAGPT